jgi:hypothetical protein
MGECDNLSGEKNTMKHAVYICIVIALFASCSSSHTGKACTFGQDQTCNDYEWVSALWGACQPDGSCVCRAGFEVNPATGRCRQAGLSDGGGADGGILDVGIGDGGTVDGGAEDGGVQSCGKYTCLGDEFCVERIHDHDAGAAYSTWQCMMYWNECLLRECSCAVKSFISQSCMNPVCTSSAPVRLRCDDLN